MYNEIKDSYKIFIEQIALNENPTIWNNEKVKKLLVNNVLVGFLFIRKNDSDFLNMYFINKQKYKEPGISQNEIDQAKAEFYSNKKPIFKNPPLKEWLETKENWCKKLATRISKTYNWTMSEALSEIYFIITKCYNKPHVYIGNLGYIQKSVITSIMLCHRYNSKRLNYLNPNVISLDTVLSTDDDKPLTIEDTLEAVDEYYENERYIELEKSVIKLLKTDFSDREIEQLLKNTPTYLPKPLYSKLLRWRKKHNVKEVLNEYK